MKVKHIYLTAKDPRKLADFYGRCGLAVRFADEERWIQFKSQDAAFCVASTDESMVFPSTNAVVVFEVEDLQSAVDRATEMGATVTASIRDMGAHGRVVQMRDPEDNAIQMYQPHRTATG